MRYEPKQLFNPTEKTVEFMYDRTVYQVEPGKKKLFDGPVAYHALNQVNTGLVEYEAGMEEHPEEAYEEMSWSEVRSLASARGIYKVGMSKDQVIEALRNA